MKTLAQPRSLLRRLFRFCLWVFLAAIVAVTARCLYVFRDRNPGYSVALNIGAGKATAEGRPLRVGFGRVKINPDLSDPKHPVWLAGFNQHRAATRIHDDLWAIACVLDDGSTRLGVVVLDAIGFFHDDVIAVRRHLAPEWKIDYSIVCSTHNHSTPDLMGLWGPDYLHTGVDARYKEQVITAAARAMGAAVAALEPARVAFHEIPVATAGLVADTRKPIIFDPGIRVMHFTRPGTVQTIGSLVAWADHPETPWGSNTEITADYCGFLRDALENGMQSGADTPILGVGGTHLYVNGAIGGLLSTTPSVTVHDPWLNQDFQKPSHEKSRAVGRVLASLVLQRLYDTNAPAATVAPISIRARTLEVPMDNIAFLLAPVLGLLDRGQPHWKTLRTEVALITVGDAAIACIPGEIYPEIVNGGIEQAPGGDFPIAPLEVPPIREFMPGKIKFVFGLANDEIGYIIPKSEWDQHAPYLYGAPKGVYGEINSVGPDTANTIHAALRSLAAEK